MRTFAVGYGPDLKAAYPHDLRASKMVPDRNLRNPRNYYEKTQMGD